MLKFLSYCLFFILYVNVRIGYGEAANGNSKLSNEIHIQSVNFPVTEFKENYLKEWAKKYTEIKEIPKCRYVPPESEEEKQIGKNCSARDRSLICSNISLFNVVRKLCAPYLNNIEQLRGGAKDVIDKIGVGGFANADFGQMIKKLEKRTKVKLSNFLKRDIQDLFTDVINGLPLPQ